ncbi:MAG: hypothetical protein LC117_02815 [Bacteroidia bacterium]|nr:hypothetical protein [Bacteroidia bacterium]MCZ2276845.1 hypothetical protein [Bacteroidia bacterium]
MLIKSIHLNHKLQLIAVLMVCATQLNGQAIETGMNIINGGIGLGGRFGGFTYGSQTPGLSLNYERMLWEAGDVGLISLGAYAGIKSYKNSGTYYSSYTYSQKWNYTIIGIRSAFHYTALENDQFDLYGGILLSYNMLSYKYEDNDPYSNYNINNNYGSAAGLTAFAGGRYFFTSNIGLFAEAGYGVSYLTIGVSFKF